MGDEYDEGFDEIELQALEAVESSSGQTLKSALKKYFGYSSFRPSQERVITAVLRKNDALMVAATGENRLIQELARCTLALMPIIQDMYTSYHLTEQIYPHVVKQYVGQAVTRRNKSTCINTH